MCTDAVQMSKVILVSAKLYYYETCLFSKYFIELALMILSVSISGLMHKTFQTYWRVYHNKVYVKFVMEFESKHENCH